MKIIQQIGNVFIPRKETTIKDLKIEPGDTFHSQDNEGNIGTFGCAYATQVELNRQIEYKGKNE